MQAKVHLLHKGEKVTVEFGSESSFMLFKFLTSKSFFDFKGRNEFPYSLLLPTNSVLQEDGSRDIVFLDDFCSYIEMIRTLDDKKNDVIHYWKARDNEIIFETTHDTTPLAKIKNDIFYLSSELGFLFNSIAVSYDDS